MRQRNCTNSKIEPGKASQRICIPISREEYAEIVEDQRRFRDRLDGLMKDYPELFPAEISQGYQLYGFCRPSVKMPEVRVRRIGLTRPEGLGEPVVYHVVPSFVMPYMTGDADAVEKALFLRRFGVPFWALTYVFGRDDMYWQRLVVRLGQPDIVGTTLKDPDQLPEHVLADEKHTRLNGQKAYIATTVAAGCIFGAALALAADEPPLREAYQHFKQEAQRLKPDYQPQTVNTDGWSPTQRAWQALFPGITLILCFLHAFLSIRSRGKQLKATFLAIQQRVWDVYHAPDPDCFLQRIADLQGWAHAHVTGPTLDAILKLCSTANLFVLAFAYPLAHRTSNLLDRQLDSLDRCLYAAHYFHGHLRVAEYQVRAWPCFITFCLTALAPKSVSNTFRLFTSSTALCITLTGFRTCLSLRP
jgi:hypothetical protein